MAVITDNRTPRATNWACRFFAQYFFIRSLAAFFCSAVILDLRRLRFGLAVTFGPPPSDVRSTASAELDSPGNARRMASISVSVFET